jgi:hypothetical protein
MANRCCSSSSSSSNSSVINDYYHYYYCKFKYNKRRFGVFLTEEFLNFKHFTWRHLLKTCEKNAHKFNEAAIPEMLFSHDGEYV